MGSFFDLTTVVVNRLSWQPHHKYNSLAAKIGEAEIQKFPHNEIRYSPCYFFNGDC